MQLRGIRGTLRATVAFIAIAPVWHAQAQEASDVPEAYAKDEIVVTAQKRSQSLQSVPLAVTAITGEMLEERGITSLQDVAQQAPNLNIAQQIGQTRITLRGVGVDNIGSPAAETNIAFNQDDIFFARSAAALASFYDVERIEILRGPQGTLFGRNATGGAVNIYTRRPTRTLDGYVQVTFGNYSTINTEGAIGGPLGSTVSARLSFQTHNRDGYGKNLVTGNDIDDKNSEAGRGQVLWEPSDRFTILLGGDYYHQRDASGGFHSFGIAGEVSPGVLIDPVVLQIPGNFIPDDPFDIAAERDPFTHAKYYGGRVDARYELTDELTLRSLSAIRRSRFYLETDLAPAGPTAVTQLHLTENSNQFSQELQLNGSFDRHQFVLGGFYLRERTVALLDTALNLLLVGAPVDLFTQGAQLDGTANTRAFAVFAQDTFSITPRLRISLGARYSWERKSVDEQSGFDLATPWPPTLPNPAPHRIESKSFDSFDPKIGIEFDLAPDVLFYASYSTAFKSGVYNLGSSTPVLEPETIDAYEAGLKSSFLNRRVIANIAGFYYDYKNLQVPKVALTNLLLENAASARIYGLESEFQARPVDPLLLTLSANWLHARFVDYVTGDGNRPGQGDTTDPDTGSPAFDLRGSHLPQAPDYTISVGAEYAFNLPFGELTLRGQSLWRGRTYLSQYSRKEISQPANNLINLSANFTDSSDKFYLNAYLRNLTNKAVRASAEGSSNFVGGLIIGFMEPPRTFGVTAGYRF